MTELVTKEEPAELKATPALTSQLEVLLDLDYRIAKLRERQAELAEQRDEIRSKVALKIEPGFWKIGDFTLRRTIVEARPSIDAWKAIEENAVPEAVLRPYMTERRPFEKWTLNRRRRARVSA